MARAKTIEDYKAISMNAMHSSMKITDEFYSNLSDRDVEIRIASLRQTGDSPDHEELALIRDFLGWMKQQKG